MLTIEKTTVSGWEAALRGMRNPMNSWDMSDSSPGCQSSSGNRHCVTCGAYPCVGTPDFYTVGDDDLDLMRRLSKSGSDHRKFMRMITVSMDVTAPLYWWKEYDTYKVGTVANSCSTMHKIHEKVFTLEDFSHEHLIMSWGDPEDNKSFIFSEFDAPLDPDDEFSDTIKFTSADSPLNVLEHTITALNHNRAAYVVTKDKRFWWQMIQLLPSSYNQKRTIMLNYEVLANIYKSRRTHKLDEWHIFCDWVETLPHSEIIIEGKW